jgi:hypothetical protein
MKFGVKGVLAAALAGLVLTAVPGVAHHPISGKFDDTKPMTLTGIVTLVDWRNPHVHVFMNVGDPKNELQNWAVEIESPILLQQSGWLRESVQPGDSITVEGIAARNGSRQVWGRSIKMAATGRQVLNLKPYAPPEPLAARPTPRWPDKTPRLGAVSGGTSGYWAYPSETVLMEDGVNVATDQYGLLKNIGDASKVAPLQPWAQALYVERQRRFLQDDPMYLNCKPPGGPRQYQQPYGIQLIEDRERQRIFVLVGSGNSNFRIIYLDARAHAGQVGGDDDNPLYYGRSVGKWEGETLVVDSRGFNEDFWFTNGGLPHTTQLGMIERFTRENFDTLRYEVTIDDPGAYTRPWKSSWALRWVAGEELPKHMCQDNRP